LLPTAVTMKKNYKLYRSSYRHCEQISYSY